MDGHREDGRSRDQALDELCGVPHTQRTDCDGNLRNCCPGHCIQQSDP